MTGRALVFAIAAVALGASLSAAPVAADDGSPTVTVDEPVNASTSTSTTTSVTVSDGTLLLTGTATDADGISHLTVARTYEYHDSNDDGRRADRDIYYASPDASNGSFRHAVPLGTGTNEVNLSVVDGAGYPTKVNIVVTVKDTEPPTPHRLSATGDGAWVRIDGWVRDNVQVGAVYAGGQRLQVQTGKRDLDREEVRLDTRVPRPSGDTVTVRLVDQAGNSRDVRLPIDGATTPTPTPTPTPTDTPQSTAPTTATPAPTPTATGTPELTPPPVSTPTPAPSNDGGSIIGLVGVVIVVGAVVMMLNAGGGGW